jgi:hypothetical protein
MGLYTDFLPEEVVGRPDHEKWFTVVDSRGRVRWHTKSGGGFDVLVLVARATTAAYLAHLREERICSSSSGRNASSWLLPSGGCANDW